VHLLDESHLLGTLFTIVHFFRKVLVGYTVFYSKVFLILGLLFLDKPREKGLFGQLTTTNLATRNNKRVFSLFRSGVDGHVDHGGRSYALNL
jgi:hypothetical protein